MSGLDAYAQPLREFISADFKATRKELGLTQEQMAELLCIDWRSYFELEHGKSLCCTPVFLRYVFQCKEDPAPFMEQVRQVMMGVDAKLAG